MTQVDQIFFFQATCIKILEVLKLILCDDFQAKW